MKPNKGFITVLMMVLISISLSTFSRAAFDTFSDVPNDSPFHESIFYLAERGIVCGEGNGRYVPDAPVTVRQWATMLCRALGDAAPLNYDDDCIRQGYSDGWLEMTAIGFAMRLHTLECCRRFPPSVIRNTCMTIWQHWFPKSRALRRPTPQAA